MRLIAQMRRSSSPISIPSKIDSAYLAGLFDGEGCLDMRTTYTTHKDKRYGPYYIPRITIANVHKGVMDWLVGAVGGSYHTTHRENDRHRECLKWQISGTNVMQLLEAMRPYIKIKKDQVEFVLNDDARNEEGLKHLQDLKWGRV